MKAVVSEKGQVTIPKKLRDSLGLKPGQVIEFEEVDGSLVGRKVYPDGHPVDLMYGTLSPDAFFGLSVDEFIDEIRGPVPASIKEKNKPRDRAAS